MTEEQLFSSIVRILKRKGKKYKKRVGFWYCFDFNAGLTLVYDSVFEFMSIESGHEQFTQEGYFGPTVKLEAFFGSQTEIVIDHDYLTKIRDKLKKE